jgi:hypothetical protein
MSPGLLFALFMTAFPLCEGQDAAVGSKAPNWSLQDLNGVTYDSSRFLRRKLLIIGGDKASQNDNEIWGHRVMKTCGDDLVVIAVADVSSAPWLFRSRVKAQLRGQESTRPSSRAGVPLLLDWEGALARSYHFMPRVSNVVLIGPDGILRYRASGPVTEQSVTQLCNAIKTLVSGKQG